jgi:ADP-heptose:LPS heptosyltransferase
MDSAFLRELADIPGAERIAWYGLQKPRSPEPPPLRGFIDLSPHMSDFMDAARMATCLDLIVTVDASMAHLAGFLGLPAIVLLARFPDWRWGLGEVTPWYPSLKLLRQPSHGDWKGAMEKLKTEIQRRMLLT